MYYENVYGWFDFQDVYDEVVQHLGEGDRVAELGVWHGRSLIYLAEKIKESGKDIHLYGIDHFRVQPGQSEVLHTEFLNQKGLNYHPVYRDAKNLKLSIKEIAERFVEAADVAKIVTLVQAKTVEAAPFFEDESFKFVMIDAGHDYNSVKPDMDAWWPKVTPNWYLAGHDYSSLFPGVMEAVKEFAAKHKLEYKLMNTVWIFRKPQNVNN
jgi:hypothetical protein